MQQYDQYHQQITMTASKSKPLPPVHFFSHGSTMMLGEESESADC